MTGAKREKPRQARAPRGYHIGGAIPSYAGDRAAPNPPTRGPTRWEVVLRLHARHAIRTGLVTDKSISTLRRSAIPAATGRQFAGPCK